MTLVRIRPAPIERRAFAAWAVEQRPKIRTCGPEAFSVPAALYVQMPEALLIGALIEGQPYIPVADTVDDSKPPQAEPESEAPGLPAAPDGVLLGVATAEALTADPAPDAEDNPSSDDTSSPAADSPTVTCRDCDRTFTSKRGLRTHRRQAHMHTEE